MNKKGSLMDLPINLLMIFISITFLVALIPAFVEMQNTSQQSDGLNCKGYTSSTDLTLSYNSSLATNSVACMAIKMYIPYIVLGVLIAGVAIIFYGRGGQQQQPQYG
jgi:hypothetical protein